MYVIINGVSSDTIQGLQVLSLPPITKPKMRWQVDTIDGRAGDIITELGYEAYDRTITVLLHHNYDLDAITAFFNTSGEIIFSNEPDKKYYFRLLEKIDYERAVQFKTANITFHVQPYKYPVNETPLTVSTTAWEGTDYDQTPYIFRAVSDSSVEVGNREIVEQITGGTVAWNQSLEEGLRSSGNTTKVAYNRCNATFNSTTHEYTLTSLQNKGTSGFYYGANQGAVINPNHVYIISFEAKAPKTFNVKIGLNPVPVTKTGFAQNVYHSIGAVVKIDSSTTEFIFNFNADNAWDGSETVYARNLMVIDITQMFGTTIADYIYSLETATAGAGVSLFKSLFPKDYYTYNSGELMSVKTSAHKTYDANDNVLGSYPLSPVELRGIPKLVNNKLQYDGDIYKADGIVERRFGIVDLGTLSWTKSSDSAFYSTNVTNFARVKTVGQFLYGNAMSSKYAFTEASSTPAGTFSLFYNTGYSGNRLFVFDDFTGKTAAEVKAYLSGVYLVYELASPTTETTTPYTETQICSPYGTEEFIDSRDVQIPVGHKTRYKQINDPAEIIVPNAGNVPSAPTIQLTGSGTVGVYLGNAQTLQVNIPEDGITIDTEAQDATSNGQLANRSVTGDYDSVRLQPGDNDVSFSGDVSAVITNYTRWV